MKVDKSNIKYLYAKCHFKYKDGFLLQEFIKEYITYFGNNISSKILNSKLSNKLFDSILISAKSYPIKSDLSKYPIFYETRFKLNFIGLIYYKFYFKEIERDCIAELLLK